MAAKRRSINIYDYPEHLNPFYEDDVHNRIRFWDRGKKIIRTGSFSFSDFKSLPKRLSFRSKTKTDSDTSPKTSYQNRIYPQNSNHLYNNKKEDIIPPPRASSSLGICETERINARLTPTPPLRTRHSSGTLTKKKRKAPPPPQSLTTPTSPVISVIVPSASPEESTQSSKAKLDSNQTVPERTAPSNPFDEEIQPNKAKTHTSSSPAETKIKQISNITEKAQKEITETDRKIEPSPNKPKVENINKDDEIKNTERTEQTSKTTPVIIITKTESKCELKEEGTSTRNEEEVKKEETQPKPEDDTTKTTKAEDTTSKIEDKTLGPEKVVPKEEEKSSNPEEPKPTKEEATTKNGVPAKDEVLTRDKVPTKDQVPTKDEVATKEEVTTMDGVLTKDEVHTKDEVPTKEEKFQVVEEAKSLKTEVQTTEIKDKTEQANQSTNEDIKFSIKDENEVSKPVESKTPKAEDLNALKIEEERAKMKIAISSKVEGPLLSETQKATTSKEEKVGRDPEVQGEKEGQRTPVNNEGLNSVDNLEPIVGSTINFNNDLKIYLQANGAIEEPKYTNEVSLYFEEEKMFSQIEVDDEDDNVVELRNPTLYHKFDELSSLQNGGTLSNKPNISNGISYEPLINDEVEEQPNLDDPDQLLKQIQMLQQEVENMTFAEHNASSNDGNFDIDNISEMKDFIKTVDNLEHVGKRRSWQTKENNFMM